MPAEAIDVSSYTTNAPTPTPPVAAQSTVNRLNATSPTSRGGNSSDRSLVVPDDCILRAVYDILRHIAEGILGHEIAFGPDVEVLTPDELRQTLARKAAETATIYTTSETARGPRRQ
jgi:hypothetical protein